MRPDKPGDAEARAKHYAACEQARKETVAKFGPFTAENVAQALAWQEKRIAELRNA